MVLRCETRAETILMREGSAARMMGRRLGVTMRMLVKVTVVVGLAVVGSGAAKRSAMDGTGVLQEGGLCVVEGERSRVGGEAGEGDVLDPVARQRVTDGAGRVEGSGVARGEGHGDENREERGVVEHVPESVGVGEGVGGGRDAVAVAVVFEGVTVCGGKPVGLSGGGV